ncbi:histidine kinase [filamentous cyanobacterium CCT1]|nr:histidine kinase [filamentous cyanobacterium CCT1]PSN76789.1 histidine kinase [filamentous cyanobacterium CCP4]
MENFGPRRWQQLARWPMGLVPGVLVVAVVIATRGLGWWQGLEWKALDTFLRSRPAEPLDDRIVIVGIGEADIQQVGTYPIPDRYLADLITTLETYQPRVIGLDIYRDLPVQPGHDEFRTVAQGLEHLVTIEKLLPPPVTGPNFLPPERIGFVDVVPDGDGFWRRSLLGAATDDGVYHFAFTLRLAERYLAQAGLSLENGIRNPVAMRFGPVELAPLTPNAGGYVGADMGGHQVLVNYRSGPSPFRRLTMAQVQTGQVEPEWLRDRIVLIGVTAPSIKDFANSAAIVSDNPGLVFGIEFQAHAISQIISAALDNRPLLRVWPQPIEYGWIILWGAAGLGLGRILRHPLWQLLVVGGGSLVLLGTGFGLLLWQGWWIPVVPTLAVFTVNGVVFPLFYWYDRGLRSRIQERQRVIDNTFSAIHNGPLQTLSQLLRESRDPAQMSPALHRRLHDLNRDLRQVYTLVQQEALIDKQQIYLGPQGIDLSLPLHQLLYQVYTQTLGKDLPGFQTLKVKLIEFEPMSDRTLSLDDRRDLCRFLQEALLNVGKHAPNTTRLWITCKQIAPEPAGVQNLIRVADNNQDNRSEHLVYDSNATGGQGTQQAEQLSKRLRGQFRRYPNSPTGTVCELVWPTGRRSLWPFKPTALIKRSKHPGK